MRFAIELFASDKGMSNLKRVGVDMESAIFNGLKLYFQIWKVLFVSNTSMGKTA